MNNNLRIKIFFFIDSYRTGGMHRQILYLFKHLNKDVFEPVICTQISIGGLREEFEQTGCKLFDLKWRRKYDLTIVPRLVSILKYEKPHVIFITEAQPFLYYRLARIFWHRKVVQIGSFRALTFWKGHLKKLYQPIDIFFSKLFFATSDCIVVNSIAMKENYLRILKTSQEKSINVIYNGSDFNFDITKSAYEIRQELNIGLNEVIIVMVARLDPWKDFSTLLDAAKIVVKTVPGAKFILIGDGILRSNLEQMISQMNLQETVFLTGERNEVFSYINAADISVLSTHGEGFSNSIMEAMALGKPVIATNVGGNAELLGTMNEFGILVPPKSAGLFADAIILLMKDKVLRDKIGQSARQRIHQICDLREYISSYEDLFIQSLEKKKILKSAN